MLIYVGKKSQLQKEIGVRNEIRVIIIFTAIIKPLEAILDDTVKISGEIDALNIVCRKRHVVMEFKSAQNSTPVLSVL